MTTSISADSTAGKRPPPEEPESAVWLSYMVDPGLRLNLCDANNTFTGSQTLRVSCCTAWVKIRTIPLNHRFRRLDTPLHAHRGPRGTSTDLETKIH